MHGFAQGETVRFVDGEGEILDEVEFILHENVVYLPFNTIKSVFDSEMTHSYYTPLKQLTINTKGKVIKVEMGKSSVIIDSSRQTETLTNPPRYIQGQPMLPIIFFQMVLPKLDDVTVIYKPELQRIRILKKSNLDSGVYDTNRTWTIIIDPGHGGEDDLGCKSQNGIFEKDIVLKVAKEMQMQCKNLGFAVQLTRDHDVKKSREQRFQYANRHQGQLFISLHCNASFSQNHKGIRLYLNNPYGMLRFRTAPIPIFGKKSLNVRTQANFLNQSKDFASVLQKELNFLSEDSIVLSEFPIITLNDVYMPAVLVELGYLSNTDDVARLSNPEHITELAQAVVHAIQLYSSKVDQSTKTNKDSEEDSSNINER